MTTAQSAGAPGSDDRVERAGLDVYAPLAAFVEDEALPGTGIDADAFWGGLASIIADLTPENRRLLGVRDELQAAIDQYHKDQPGLPDPAKYTEFLREIGYLVEEPADFTITTTKVDTEVADVAGPQLVVPLLNARFAINAANARWGSLYDALYGTDAIADEGELARGTEFNTARAAEVVRRGREILDQSVPLESGSHADATAYRVEDGALRVDIAGADSAAGTTTGLADPSAFVGYTGDAAAPATVLLVHNKLHLELVVDHSGAIGSTDSAGVQDIVVESAISTIMDLEDSVAAVVPADKVLGYRNWRELVSGTLTEEVTKNGRTFTRSLNPDREYTGADGTPLVLPGRSLLWIRNVGHLMRTDAVKDAEGQDVFEGILDAAITALGTLPDLSGERAGTNSREGSIYVVKPKMHGPAEVAFAAELFSRVEALLGLEHGTIKMGIMDEERRTTVNLRAAIAEAADRVAFINTGFLDRTGDEIHTSLHAGVVLPKGQIKGLELMAAYETANVDAGLRAGFSGKAQIGKGMWAAPDLMADMLEQKGAHPRTGANTAWVPSPTAATLHALHYLEVDVDAVRAEITGREPQSVDPILVPPLTDQDLSDDDVRSSLDDNVQSILGYVVRWIDQGVGCSKVPDINGIALMEDRATLRISSQLLANWLHHGVITVADVDDALQRLAPVVDEQNAGDPNYEALIGEDGPGVAFRAARALIVEGADQPNGYTEPILHRMRREKLGAPPQV
ncbi:malate synthase G [Georgenia sp. Z1344]|uniref:malate synthase G n=1 Tax=Georgenia sp. Z1344 TaxID=3416706 RepID=UPI003CEF08E2